MVLWTGLFAPCWPAGRTRFSARRCLVAAHSVQTPLRFYQLGPRQYVAPHFSLSRLDNLCGLRKVRIPSRGNSRQGTMSSLRVCRVHFRSWTNFALLLSVVHWTLECVFDHGPRLPRRLPGACRPRDLEHNLPFSNGAPAPQFSESLLLPALATPDFSSKR